MALQIEWLWSRNLGMWNRSFLSYSAIVSTEILFNLLITTSLDLLKYRMLKQISQNSLKTDDDERLSGSLYYFWMLLRLSSRCSAYSPCRKQLWKWSQALFSKFGAGEIVWLYILCGTYLDKKTSIPCSLQLWRSFFREV